MNVVEITSVLMRRKIFGYQVSMFSALAKAFVWNCRTTESSAQRNLFGFFLKVVGVFCLFLLFSFPFFLSRSWIELKTSNEFSGFLKAEISDSEDVFYCWRFTSHCDDFRQLIYLFYAQSPPSLKRKKRLGEVILMLSLVLTRPCSLLLLLFGVEEWLLWEISR